MVNQNKQINLLRGKKPECNQQLKIDIAKMPKVRKSGNILYLAKHLIVNILYLAKHLIVKRDDKLR